MVWQSCLKEKNTAALKDTSLTAVNKKIYELKKKIQLSDGRRKAQFEECCAEKERNNREIKQLNKEIKQLRERLGKPPDRAELIIQTIAKYPEDASTLRTKKNDEALEVIDYKCFNQKKALSRLAYAEKMHEDLLKRLMIVRNDLFHEVSLAYVREKDKASEEKICSLENQIHVVEMNLMEAEHIFKKYRSIEDGLMHDSVTFERTMHTLREAADRQQKEIAALKNVHREAIGLRDKSKGTLFRQEETAIHRGQVREKQLAEYRGMVEERKLELERLERHIFPTGRPLIHQDSESETDLKQNAEENANTLNIERLEEAFTVLKECTGVTEIEEVLERFLSQNATQSRLSYLKSIAEEEKHDLEKRQECMLIELEGFKFAEVKDKEQNVEENEKVKKAILEQTHLRDTHNTETRTITDHICNIRAILYSFIKKLEHMDNSHDDTETSNDIFAVMDALKRKLTIAMEFVGAQTIDANLAGDTELQELVVPIRALPEDAWMFPKSTTELGGGDAARNQPAASDEEEEVPTRTYLKRQAQILVDARSRRKQYHAVPRGRKTK